MGPNKNRVRYLLMAFIWFGFFNFLELNAQKSTIKIYACYFSTFLKIPVNEESIKFSSDYYRKFKTKNFLPHFEKMLLDEPLKTFVDEPPGLRILIEVFSKRKKIEHKILIYKGYIISFDGKFYEYNKEISDAIMMLFPENLEEKFTPSAFR